MRDPPISVGITSDAGGTILGTTAEQPEILKRFDDCFEDRRGGLAARRELSATARILISQRVLAIDFGYENMDGSDRIKLASVAGEFDP